MWYLIGYHPGYNKWIVKRKDGVTAYVSQRILNLMIRKGVIV